MKLIVLTYLIFLSINAHAQILTQGDFIGSENMWKNNYGKTHYYPGVYYEQDFSQASSGTHSRRWFHEVIISVENDSSIIITKKPYYLKDKQKCYSDSIGGFYKYECKLHKYGIKDKTKEKFGKYYISGNYIYNPNKQNMNKTSGVPLYVKVHYTVVKQTNRYIILETEFGEIKYKCLTRNRNTST